MIDLDEIKRRVEGHHIVRSVDRTSKGHVRFETSFLYPEGSAIDLFLPIAQHLNSEPSIILSDLGNSMQWLVDVQVRPSLSKKRQAYVKDVLSLFNVVQVGGALETVVATLDELMPGIVRLGQTCVRVADLIYTRRSSLQLPVSEEVEEVFAERSLEYEKDAEIEGRFQRRVRVDFLVRGQKTRSAILTLSSANSSQAHIQANEIFRRWYDLDFPGRGEQRVTILDDRSNVYRDEDIKRLREKSDVMPLSDRVALLDLVAA